MTMTLGDYAEQRLRVERYFANQTEDQNRRQFYAAICYPWFQNIAPQKAEEYGTECWERMGAKALLVDINACYYRYKNLTAMPLGKMPIEPLRNALVDGFGYCVILSVITGKLPQDDMWENKDPEDLKEMLLHDYWDESSSWWSRGVTLSHQLAYNMWRTVR